MPLALAGPTTRARVEPIARKFQRRADRRVASVRRDLAALMRASRAGVDMALLKRGVAAHDFTLIREAVPNVKSDHVPIELRKAENDRPPGDTDIGEALADTYWQQVQYAVSLVPRFDLVDQNAVEYARTHAGQLLTDLDQNAMANARAAVAWGIEHGRTVDQTAQFLAETLYLPPRATAAIQSYFEGLLARIEAGDDIAEAARALRDAYALSPTKFLDAQNIDTLVGRYADRWVDYYAETVARTMTIEASNMGLRDGWDQAGRAGLFDPSTAELEWYATDDERTCDECDDLNGEIIPFDGGAWDTSQGTGETPPAHPNCRCTLVLLTNDPDAEINAPAESDDG